MATARDAAFEEYKNLAASEMKRTVEKFGELRQFLEKQEKLVLNEIEEVQREVLRRRDEHRTRLPEEFPFIGGIFEEEEVKQQKLMSQQDVRSDLQRSEKKSLNISRAFPAQQESKLSRIRQLGGIIQNAWMQFKTSRLFRKLRQEENVTLNPQIADHSLILSEDWKSMTREDKPQPKFDFTDQPCVLGCEEFTKGRHFWEVNVGNGEGWAVVVARDSVQRRGFYSISPEGEISLEEPRWIQVTLDHKGECVSFCDAHSGAELYPFSGVSFSGEILLPLSSSMRIQNQPQYLLRRLNPSLRPSRRLSPDQNI